MKNIIPSILIHLVSTGSVVSLRAHGGTAFGFGVTPGRITEPPRAAAAAPPQVHHPNSKKDDHWRITHSSSSSHLYTASSEEVYEYEEDISLRFSGVGRLYHDEENSGGEKAAASNDKNAPPHMDVVQRLSESTVAVIGIGGVGSWAAEAICRSGVGNIILLDLDDICTSNINRQLHALSSTVGNMKIDVTKQRLLDINPTCNVTLVHDFVGVDTANDIVQALKPEVDVILDAIDGTDEKAALLAAACYYGVSIVTCGGAAGRVDPTKVLCDDLTKTSQCRLLFWTKKQLRDKYKIFPKGMSKAEAKRRKTRTRKWRIWAVYSEEVVQDRPKSSGNGGGGGNNNGERRTSSLRTCDGPLGTACFVTGTYGFVAASKVISMLANDELIKPKILKSALAALQD